MVETAVRRGGFARAFKAQTEAPADLSALVDQGLAKAALSALGLARRCGDAVVGFEKVRSALKERNAAVLIAAADAADDGRDKLAGLGRGVAPVALFTRAELSAALGRDAVHVAIKPGASALRFEKAATRLAAYRMGADEEG